LKARASVDIGAASEVLLRENLRVNRSLYDTGKITEDQVLRAQAELLAVEQQKREVQNLERQARSYCNFLLKRPLMTPIEPSNVPSAAIENEQALEILSTRALKRRPELGRLEQLRAASAAQVDAAR